MRTGSAAGIGRSLGRRVGSHTSPNVDCRPQAYAICKPLCVKPAPRTQDSCVLHESAEQIYRFDRFWALLEQLGREARCRVARVTSDDHERYLAYRGITTSQRQP